MTTFRGVKEFALFVASGADPGISERGVVHYRSNLEHQWCGWRVTAPASDAIS